MVGNVLSPVVLGASLAFIFNVPMRAIEGRLSKISRPKLRRLFSVIITLLLVLLVLALVFYLLIPQLTDTVQSLIPKLQTFFGSLETDIKNFLKANPKVMDWITVNTDLENLNFAGLVEKALSVVGNSVTTILGGMMVAIGSITGALMNIVIAIVFAFYCLFQKETLSRQGRKLLYAFAPEKAADTTIRILRLTNDTFANFLSGQCIEVCILGAMFAIGMAICRMPYIPLVSVLIAITAFIPVVGAWIGCACGTFLMLVSDPIQALFFVGLFILLQQIENNVIYPRVVGTSIGLSGMWVLVAVSVGGALFGVAGMFLMIPMAAVIHTLLREAVNKKLEDKKIDPEKLKPVPYVVKSRHIDDSDDECYEDEESCDEEQEDTTESTDVTE
ncbi:MAG: AI-2E family transporter [Oscillospiraceae bacterium]|nr:AI-2E family transporter [Oscillospiraceae bacterium]